MKILLTGFEPFGGLSFNPSQAIVERAGERTPLWHGVELVTAVLPTRYREADRQIRRIIRDAVPDAVIALGVAVDSDLILLERFAVNIDDCPSPDNSGERRIARPIVHLGPAAYRSTLPLSNIHACLSRRGLTAAFSNHAGTYLCNHVFYVACHEIALSGRKTPCGFVHVPMPATHKPEETTDRAVTSLMPVVDCSIEALFTD